VTEVLSIYFYFVLSLLFFIIGANLCFKKGILATKFLGAEYLTITWLIFSTYFTNDLRILEYPHFFRLPTPFVYLIYPLAFLFQAFLLNPARRFRKWDLLHFLPFAITFLKLIPFYLSSADFKLAFIQEALQQHSLKNVTDSPIGGISMQIHASLRMIQFFGYQVVLILHLGLFLKGKSAPFIRANQKVVNWLLISVGFKFVTLAFAIIVDLTDNAKLFTFQWYDLLKIANYIAVAIYLFFNPRLLDGVILKELVVSNLNRGDHFEESAASKIKTDLDNFKTIETALLTTQRYLHEDITVNILSDELDIAPRKISAALRQAANLSFPDYISSLRIQYIEEKMSSDPQWKKYTFEAMAFESGFGSRSNFYQAFKKLKGITPKAYFENLS
jgi:AraC-like DNA-binding protein